MIGIRATEGEYARVQRWAERKGMSVTTMVRKAVESEMGGPLEPAEGGRFDAEGESYEVTYTEWIGRRPDRDERYCLLLRVLRCKDELRAAAVFSLSGPLEVTVQIGCGSLERATVERFYLGRLRKEAGEMFSGGGAEEGALYYRMFMTSDTQAAEFSALT